MRYGSIRYTRQLRVQGQMLNVNQQRMELNESINLRMDLNERLNQENFSCMTQLEDNLELVRQLGTAAKG